MSNNIANPDALNLPYYVATYQGRSVAIKRDADYQNTIKLVQKSIAKLRSVDPQDILISTTLADYGGALVQISEEIWPDVVGDIKTVEVSLDDPTDAGCPDSGGVAYGKVALVRPEESVASATTVAGPITEHTPARDTPRLVDQDPANTVNDPSHSIRVTVRPASQELLNLGDFRSSSTIGDIKSLIETTYRVPAILQRLDLLGQPLDDAKTLEQCRITDWTILDLYLNARQSMIYLYPDPGLQTSERFRHKDIKVQLSLNRAWELAALRPSIGAPLQEYSQAVSWTVDVASGGLLDHSSNTEVTCLFWDGISRPAQPVILDPPRSPSHLEPHPPHGLSNLVPLLDPTNSAAVPFSQVEAYVQSALYQTGFTSCLTSPTHFVSHLKQKPYEYIALRFVPRVDFEPASSLSVSPPTQHIVRVLVLYKGLSAVTAGIWDISRPQYAQGSDPWKDVVGIEPGNYWYEQAGLKVLEIAWMEVC
ncbi:hypothetical protein FRC08_009521 [Ceratobasidium sp. 394]|nr:hypothetical protein FRC08_009521 [Ceratobasidium sp. 394]KAG9085617.1 hypothetical protein FS749_004283 [Ceratobasidium sp. UAMH 11750]